MFKLNSKLFTKISFYVASIIVYGLIYYTIVGYHNFHYSDKLHRQPSETEKLFRLVYFSAITQSTVGYGDIFPNTRLGKVIVMSQLLVPFFVVLS